MSVLLVSTYCILFLGSCSPIHSRAVVAIGGLITIGVSFTCGNGISGTIGYQTAGVHNLLAFLMIGIGADDMFVLCNAIDQTDFDQTVEERFKKAFASAGPSITITSFTNVISFFVGSLTPIIALGSFCIYAAFSVMVLYTTCLSIFGCFMVWDTKRVHNRKGDCCRLCCCAENTVICCRGTFLNDKQKKYSGIVKDEVIIPMSPVKGSEKKDNDIETAIDFSAKKEKPEAKVVTDPFEDQKFSSNTERFLATKIAPELLSKEGRTSLLAVYSILIVCALYGCS